MTMSIESLFSWACSGDIENLKDYYASFGKVNRRYEKFGKSHSLIAGAYRNGQTNVIEYLLKVGETITEDEKPEIQDYINGLGEIKTYIDILDKLKNFAIHENWDYDKVPEQIRAMFTTLCIIGEIEADTVQADNILYNLYNDAAMEDLITYEDFCSFMYELIV